MKDKKTQNFWTKIESQAIVRAEPIGFTFWGGTGKINKLETSAQYVQ